jgi:hypothetical protein
MGLKNYYFIISFYLTLFLLLFIGTVFSEEDSTIIGIITKDSQLITDEGNVYDITKNEQADKLVKKINVRVEIKGTIGADEDTGSKYIRISSFKVIKK